MPNYNNTVIYKIKHNEDYDDLNIYVGSTTNFRLRKHQHKSDCNNENRKKYNLKIYKYIRDNGGWDQFVMVLIEEYSCNSNNEKEIRERYHIDILKPKLNKIIPGRTHKEYYEDNKELILKNHKEWRDNNKDKKKEIDKIYRKNNKKKIKEWHNTNNHREQAKTRSKEHYKNNKDEINKKRKEKITCDVDQLLEKMVCSNTKNH